MHTLWLIVKHEIITTLQKRSFWLLTVLLPALIMVLYGGMQWLGAAEMERMEAEATSVEAQAQEGAAVGYVDEAGVIREIPFWIPAGFFRAYPTQQAADAALESGEIRQYYLVPANFLETGEYLLVDRDYQPMRSISNAEIFQQVLHDNLAEYTELSDLLANPMPSVQPHRLQPATGLGQSNLLALTVSFFTLYIFFLTITISSGFMLTSVSKEKENRTIEILLLSVRPHQFMLGKIIGLGLVALLQVSVWVGGMGMLFGASEGLFTTVQSLQLPPSLLLWGLAFFILGYFMYASLMGALGALAPTAREKGQFVFLIIAPLLTPLIFNMALVENPHGSVALFLSLFPLTANSMLTRMAVTDVPLWQILASLGGLAATTYFAVLLAARFIRAEHLLSDKRWRIRQVFKALRG